MLSCRRRARCWLVVRGRRIHRSLGCGRYRTLSCTGVEGRLWLCGGRPGLPQRSWSTLSASRLRILEVLRASVLHRYGLKVVVARREKQLRMGNADRIQGRAIGSAREKRQGIEQDASVISRTLLYTGRRRLNFGISIAGGRLCVAHVGRLEKKPGGWRKSWRASRARTSIPIERNEQYGVGSRFSFYSALDYSITLGARITILSVSWGLLIRSFHF
jgi:hypothetical protein